MTVAALPSVVEYVENGVTTAFPAPFRFLEAADLVVMRRFADGSMTTLTSGVGYSVAGGDSDAGGTVTVAIAATAGTVLRIERRTSRAQTADYTPGDRFPAESHEAQLDRLSMVDEEQDDRIADLATRALLVPPGQAAGVIPSPAANVGKVLSAGVAGALGWVSQGGADSALRGDLAGGGGAGLVGFKRSGNAPAAVALPALWTEMRLQEFKASADPDWTNAFIRWNHEAKDASAAGLGVELVIPPRDVPFDLSLGYGFLQGIRNLRVKGYGSVLRNTYSGTGGYSYPIDPPAAAVLYTGDGYNGTISKFVQTVARGALAVSMVTAGDATAFAPGDWVLFAGHDIQYGGYPPNPYFFDFRLLTGSASGVLSFLEPLRYSLRSDWPEFTPGPGSHQIGKARVISLKDRIAAATSPANGYGGTLDAYRAGDVLPWAINHVYEGLDIRKAPNAMAQTYQTYSGLSIALINCSLPGTSESVCRHFSMIGGRLTSVPEPDKIVETSTYKRVPLDQGLVFQSASIDNVTVEDCPIGAGGYLSGGYAKNFVGVNNRGSWSEYLPGGYGAPIRHVLIGHSSPSQGQFDFSRFDLNNTAVPFDGINVTYANGTFAILKTAVAAYSFGTLRPVEGGKLLLYGATTTDVGVGIIRRLRDDATNIYIDTSLPFATFPSWATTISSLRPSVLTMIGCGGNEGLAAGSEAQRRGKPAGDYRRWLWEGRCAASGVLGLNGGILERLSIRVLQPTTIAGGKLRLSVSTILRDSVGTPQSYQFDTDLTATGIRDYTYRDLFGKKSGDTALLNGSAITALDPTRWSYGLLSWNFVGYTPATQAYPALPIVEVEMHFDSGLILRGALDYADYNSNLLFDIAGDLL